MFYPEGLVDFALEKSFIPKLQSFLLHRWVQKWLFAKYCPHFSFITLLKGIKVREVNNTAYFLLCQVPVQKIFTSYKY